MIYSSVDLPKFKIKDKEDIFRLRIDSTGHDATKKIFLSQTVIDSRLEL